MSGEQDINPFNETQVRALKQLRQAAAGAMAVCALLPLGAVLWLGGLQRAVTDEQVSANRAAIAVFVAAVMLGIGGRMQAYKANWQGDVVTVPGYRKGMLRYMGAVVVGHAAATGIGIAVGLPSAALDLAIFALALLFFSFPNGKPMLPQPPELGTK